LDMITPHNRLSELIQGIKMNCHTNISLQLKSGN